MAERGRDPQRYQPVDPVALAATRDQLGLDPTDRVVLVVSRLEPAKGLERVLAAVDRLVETVPNAVVLVAGRDGSAARSLASQRDGLIHRDHVRFLGHRDDLTILLQLADCWLSTPHREGAAGAMLEAWASGTPVVTVPVDGIDGIAVDGVNALVVPPDAAADAVARVLTEPDLARCLAAEARQAFEDRFTVEASADKLLGVYEWAASRGDDG